MDWNSFLKSRREEKEEKEEKEEIEEKEEKELEAAYICWRKNDKAEL